MRQEIKKEKPELENSELDEKNTPETSKNENSSNGSAGSDYDILENYDILKVEVIRRLPSDVNKEQYTLLWNAVSIMEKMILRKHNKEQLDRLRKRYLSAILDIVNNQKIDESFYKNSK